MLDNNFNIAILVILILTMIGCSSHENHSKMSEDEDTIDYIFYQSGRIPLVDNISGTQKIRYCILQNDAMESICLTVYLSILEKSYYTITEQGKKKDNYYSKGEINLEDAQKIFSEVKKITEVNSSKNLSVDYLRKNSLGYFISFEVFETLDKNYSQFWVMDSIKQLPTSVTLFKESLPDKVPEIEKLAVRN